MAQTADDLKQQAHALIERMAPGQVSAAVGLLEGMLEPLTRALLNAPYDDEPVSDEEMREIEAAHAAQDDGEWVSHEEVLAEYGLTLKDFERMGRTPLDSSGTDQ